VIIPEELEDLEKLKRYQQHYSKEKLADKLLKVAKKAGVKVIYAACLLYYMLEDEQVSGKDKLLIVGALGYFILPFDLIADFTPLVGFADDLVGLVFVVKTIYKNITPEVERKAKSRVRSLFDKVADEDFKLF
jgi:uncharacterized membrane protein YkvA (DUF1232 family)